MKKLQFCIALFCLFGVSTVFTSSDQSIKEEQRKSKQVKKSNGDIAASNAQQGMVPSITGGGDSYYRKEDTSRNR